MFPVPARAINKSGRLEGCAAAAGAAGLRFPPGRSPRREWGRDGVLGPRRSLPARPPGTWAREPDGGRGTRGAGGRQRS